MSVKYASKEVMVSICCLTYNHEGFIRQALDSFLMQKTNFEFEIVIHDDASTDNTPNILREYETKYPNIFNALYQKENQRSKFGGGMNPRFNYPRTNGKYIALCEGDDYWTDPYKLQKQVDFLEANNDYVLVSGGFLSKEIKTGSEKINLINEVEVENNSKKGFDIDLETFYKYWAVKTLTLMFRKSSLDLNYYLNYKHLSDTHLNYNLLKNGKGYYLKQIFGVYNITGKGVLTSRSKYQVLEKKYLTFKELYEIQKEERLRIIYFYSIYYILRYMIDRNESKFSFRLLKTFELIRLIRKTKEIKHFLLILPVLSYLKKRES